MLYITTEAFGLHPTRGECLSPPLGGEMLTMHGWRALSFGWEVISKK